MNELIEQLDYHLKNNDMDLNKLYSIMGDIQNSELSMNEKFHANMYAGKHYYDINFEIAQVFLLKSYYDYERVEGLTLIVQKFIQMNRLKLAYMFSCVCIFTNKIDNIGCDEFVYEYQRNYNHAALCMEMKRYEEANYHIKMAIDFLDETKDEHVKLLEGCKKIFVDSSTEMI